MKFAIFSLFSLMAALAAPCRAMSVIPPSFASLVAQAEQIARVEVTAVHSQWDEGARGNVIHTYVECRVLKTLKGTAEPTITVRMLGGRVGNDRMEIPGEPSFEVGGRYIIFLAGNGSVFCPLEGIMHGSYRVLTDAATGVDHVARSNGQALQAVEDVDLPMPESSIAAAAARKSAASSQATSGLTRDSFETAVAEELNHASTR